MRDEAPSPMTISDAEEALDGLPLVPVMAGTLQDMKALRDRCLAAGVPVLVGCPPGHGKGWGTKTHLLVEEDDIPKIAALVRGGWRDDLEKEGLAPVASIGVEAEGEHPPCPACGTAAALVDGACSDCGLQLE